MYASELMHFLHDRLGEIGELDRTKERFERLRGYSLLPRGRENAGIRLTDQQITNAVLAFGHIRPRYGGHASLVLGQLKPVGGTAASFHNAANLREAITKIVCTQDLHSKIARVTLSVDRNFAEEKYSALIHLRDKDHPKSVAFVSKMACSLLQPGAERNFDYNSMTSLSGVQHCFGPEFFRDLYDAVAISRQLNRPLETDWTEYESEEEKSEFYRNLGANQNSNFINLRVDSQVLWPKRPTRMRFGGHYLILFPQTREYSRSISIDLSASRISATDARTLINRLLSVMSWCENQPASLHEGWSGGPVPSPVSRRNFSGSVSSGWHFYRSLPEDAALLQCLSYYRDGVNAESAGLASHAVLSFYRVIETKCDKKTKAVTWMNENYFIAREGFSEDWLKDFEERWKSEGKDVGTYIYESFRVAAAHAARDRPSDPDKAEETRRLLEGAQFLRRYARSFIEQEFKFSTSYLSDEAE